MAQYINKVGYGLSDALPLLAPFPIKANRAPIAADKGYPVGQLWIYSAANEIYVLTAIANNAANWELLTLAGGAGLFTSLTVSGAIDLNTTGAAANIIGNNIGAGSLTLLTGTGGFTLDGAAATNYDIGAATIAGTITIGGVGASTGTITIAPGTGAQTVNIAASGTGAKSINIGATGSLNAIEIGSTTGASNTEIKGGTLGVTVNAPFLELINGPVFIYSGAGAPANGLALHAGDLYINTAPTGAADRIFVATGVGAWTNVTCAA